MAKKIFNIIIDLIIIAAVIFVIWKWGPDIMDLFWKIFPGRG